MRSHPPAGPAAVECSGLTVSFGGGAVLDHVDLRLGAGTVAALVGPCGAGKTTLLKVLAGLVPPAAGTARICGEEVRGDAPATRARVGYAPAEERSFYWRLSGRENLRFFAALHGLRGRERAGRVSELLREVGLEGTADRRFQEYSSGMRQALGLARALLHAPPVLLLDEPTRSLAPDVAGLVRRLLQRKARGEGVTVLMASHDLREVEGLADVVVVLDRGTVRSAGSPRELGRAAGTGGGTDLESLFDRLAGGAG